ncbi:MULTISPECIES: permease-like cell division protein FtsX [Vibrio]|uniref:Cell division protein FtsX n=2 Tax=Vibrio TaxID=662 RepID=A0A7X4LMG8_9VIBR|nr:MULTISPECIES: permease-like cell division protein FtsX [Vibrio]MBF9001933.1 cell division protein FtsX [Vibrio nitrifigilis]MZI94481.1 cell division protein FtsX [Vibrio eleionomae]
MANKRLKRKEPKSNPGKRMKTDGYFTVQIKQAKAAFNKLWQRPMGNILTLAVISMALTLPSCFYLISKNISSVAASVASSSQISVYLEEGTPEAKIMVIKDEIERRDDVDKVEYISPQQGIEDLSANAGFEQAISLLDSSALPAVLIVNPKVTQKQQIKSIALDIQKNASVTDVRLDEDWLSRLDAIRNLASILVVSLSILMLASVFLIVGNTLRFNVQSNKEEIQTMKLIGATDSYILRPYVYSGMWFGILGAIIAWVMTAIITLLLNNAVEKLAGLYDSHFQLLGLGWDESLLLLMMGTFIGCVAARVSANRHLKEIDPI